MEGPLPALVDGGVAVGADVPGGAGSLRRDVRRPAMQSAIQNPACKAAGPGRSPPNTGIRKACGSTSPGRSANSRSRSRTDSSVMRHWRWLRQRKPEHHDSNVDVPMGPAMGLSQVVVAVAVAASFSATVDTHECLLDLMFVGRATYCYTAGRGQLHANRIEHRVGV